MRKLLPLVLVLAVPVLILWCGTGERTDSAHRAQSPPSSEPFASTELEQPAAPEEELAPAAEEEPEVPSVETRAVLPAETGATPMTVTVSAKVVDTDGRPLAGIALVAASLVSQPSALTGADGEVVLVVPWDEWGRVRRCVFHLRGVGYALATETRSILEPTEVFLGRFELVPGATLVGRVVDADGTPVVGASAFCADPVTAWEENDLEQRRVSPRPSRLHAVGALTDAEGRYRIEGVPLASFSVGAHAEASLAAYSEPISLAPADTQQPVTVPDLVLETAGPESRIEGVVLTREGEPHADRSVSLQTPDGDGVFGRVRTDAQGRFRFVTLPGSVHRIQAGSNMGDAVHAYDVAAGTLDVLLQPGRSGSIRVRVTTSDGRTPTSFGGNLEVDDRTLAGSIRRSEFSTDGMQLTFDLPVREFRVLVMAAGYLPSYAGPFDPDDPPRELEVELHPVVGISGRVVVDGEPVAGARIDAHAVEPSGRVQVRRNGLHDRFSRHHRSMYAQADGEGRFVLAVDSAAFVNTQIQALLLHASADGYAHGPFVRVPVVAGAAFPDVVLELSRGGAVAGSVLAEEGRDLRGYAVRVSRADGHVRTQALDAEGGFRIEGLEPGSWQAVAGVESELERGGRSTAGSTTESEIPWSFDVLEGETTAFDLVLEPEPVEDVLLEGRFLVDGAPPIGWTWLIQDGSGYRQNAFDGEGRFEARLVEPGARTLVLRAPRAGLCAMPILQVPLDLIRGRNGWQLDLATARLVVTDLPAMSADVEELMRRAEKEGWQASWKDEAPSGPDGNGASWTCFLFCGPESGLLLPEVPAGTITLAQTRSYRPVEGTEIVVELAPGEERTVDLAE